MNDALGGAQLYCASMEEVKQRLALAEALIESRISINHEFADPELIAVQLRKVLELIAFAALTANRDRYAAVYSDFAEHWNAKKLIARLENVHPDFFPVPVAYSGVDATGIKTFNDISEPYLSATDLIFLYDKTSQVLHSRNPHRTGSAVIDFRLHLSDWIKRIKALLRTHYVRLADTGGLWLVMMSHPTDGRVHAYPAAPRTDPT